MIEKIIDTYDGPRTIFIIETHPLGDEEELDWLSCPCGVMVPQGQMCTRCHRRTYGPCVENQTRKLLTGES